MKLLFVTSRLPWPPNRGDRLRTYHLLSHLSEEHDITLLSFYAHKDELKNIDRLKAICEDVHLVHLPLWRSLLSVLVNFWRGRPLQVEYYRSKMMEGLVDRLLKEQAFSAVYIHLFRMAPYFSGYPNLYRIVDLTDAISQEIEKSLPYRGTVSRLLYKMEKNRIADFECQVLNWANEAWFISHRDRAFLHQKCPGKKRYVIPNGVNLRRFFPIEDCPKKYDLIFVGNLDVFHNVDAVNFIIEEIFPLVREKMPQCNLVIAGAGKGKGIPDLRQTPGVSFLGFVENLNDVLNRASLFLAPLRFSAGVQNKVLEAMACALPVLCAPDVASGLDATPGRDLIVAKDGQEYADEAVRVLSSEISQQKIGQAGRKFVADNFSWGDALQRMKIIEKNLNFGNSNEMNEQP